MFEEDRRKSTQLYSAHSRCKTGNRQNAHRTNASWSNAQLNNWPPIKCCIQPFCSPVLLCVTTYPHIVIICTHARMHTRTHACTYTHTHTRFCIWFIVANVSCSKVIGCVLALPFTSKQRSGCNTLLVSICPGEHLSSEHLSYTLQNRKPQTALGSQ